jgi:hypothetical protein
MMQHFLMSQTTVVVNENFNGGSMPFTATPASSWRLDTDYYVSSPASCRGIVPNMVGDSTILETGIYDFQNYSNILLRFNHICKIAPTDEAWIEYRIIGAQGWTSFLAINTPISYYGKSSNYQTTGFNSSNYPEWQSGNNLVNPSQTWWKEEIFDLSPAVGAGINVQFRFIIKHGNVKGTQINYGWLIDNFEITGSPNFVTPPVVELQIPYPNGAVANPGPYEISAVVESSTSAPLNTPYLKYTAIDSNGLIIADSTISMINTSGPLWQATIPPFLISTTVSYSVIGTDAFGNFTTVKYNYTVSHPNNVLVMDYVYYAPEDTLASSSTASTYTGATFHTGQTTSWSRLLYLHTDLDNTYLPTVITTLAWHNKASTGVNTRKIRIYMRATNDVSNSDAIYKDPVADGATLVYDGTVTTQLNWNDVILSTPFSLASGQNLLIYFEDSTGKAANNSIAWSVKKSTSNRLVCGWGNTVGAQGTFTVMRFGMNYGSRYAPVSVALTHINSPNQVNIIGGQTIPVIVTFRNKGNLTLNSLNIHWQINNGTPQDTTWNGTLITNFAHNITLDNYIPKISDYDTVKVWISNPNGIADPTTFDDTLTFISYGCFSQRSGIYTVGPNGFFKSISEAITAFKYCNPLGDVTLALDTGTHVENVNLTNIQEFMGDYNTLTITSLRNNKNNTIIRPKSGVGITIASNNIILDNITVDVAHLTVYAIQFSKVACTNVVINNCNLFANPTTTSASGGINKASEGGLVENIRFTNNTITGGQYGINFYAGTGTSALGNNIVVDGNTITGQTGYGMYLYNGKFNDISNNTIYSRTTGTTTWYGLRTNGVHANILNNRIIQQTDTITTSYGIHVSSLNTHGNPVDTALIANNEIIIYGTTANTTGLYLNTVRTFVMHNSIHVSGTGDIRGVYLNNSSTNLVYMKNNDITLASGYPIYITLATYLNQLFFEANNYYAPAFVGFIATPISNYSAWSQMVSDTRSVQIKPDFVNIASSLKLKNYKGFECKSQARVPQDLDGTDREDWTTMGCYHGLGSYTANASLQVTALKQGFIQSQTDSVRVLLINSGNTPITTAVINWSFNTVSAQKTWTGQLAPGAQTMVALGEVTYQSAGKYTIEAAIANLGSLQDENPNDDTVKMSGYVCGGAFAGTVTIGSRSNFETIKEALHAIELCGTSGDITLSLLTGTYGGNVDLSSIATAMNGNNLLITSSTGNASNVILKADGAGIVLANNHNVTIKNITVDATEGYSAVLFVDECSNIEISNCILLGDTTITTNTNNVIFKPNGTQIVNDIRIKNNIINGGYCGIYFYNGIVNTSTWPTSYTQGFGIVIENNTFTNQGNAGLQAYYTGFKNISDNTVTSRDTNTQATWYGLYLEGCNTDITSNRIIQRSNSIKQPQGIYLSSHNRYNSVFQATIANNEIKLNITGEYSGIYTDFAFAKIYHNSIYVDGSGQARGICINSTANEQMSVKNNNIVMLSSGAFPIYISSSDYIEQYDLGYNNMYDSTNIGYIGSAKTNWTQWRASFPADIYSIDSFPQFVNPNVDLKLSNYADFECTIIPTITTDIEKNIRIGATTMGCYHGLISPYTANGRLEEITGLNEGMTIGATDSIKVKFVNAGTTTINAATIHWSLNNGTTQIVTWSGILPNSESTIITLGEITYASGINTVNVYIEDLGVVTDNYHKDDTISASVYVCPSAGMNGTFIVGQTGIFTDLTAAFTQMNKCGVDGDIILKLEPETYNGDLKLSDLSSIMGNNNTLTITSTTGNPRDVIFKSTMHAITITNSNNLVIDGITVDVTKGQRAIEFGDGCANIVIKNCRILGQFANSDSWLIFKQYGNSLPSIDNIKILNNQIDGGYRGIFFPGVNQNNLQEYITIDSNKFTNISEIVISVENTNFVSISHNVIESSTNSGSSNNWTAINTNNVNGDIRANRIIQHDNGIGNPYGINVSNFNSSNELNDVFIANNEIMINGNAKAISINNSKYAKVVNNSIYVMGSSGARGIEIANWGQDENMLLKNNNIIMLSSSAYPIYFNNASNASQYDMDYNNLYAPNYVGYIGDNITSIADWKQAVSTDNHSVSVFPYFADINNDLSLLDSANLSCPLVAGVNQDITGIQRPTITTMGAYQYVDMQNDVTPLHFVDLNATYPTEDSVEIKVAIQNTGANVLTSAQISWEINGVEADNSPYSWNGNLPFGQTETVSVGKFELLSGQTQLKLYTSLPNNAIDPKTKYDTLTAIIFACDSVLNGIYTVGTGKDIADLETVLGMLQYCGINGEVTFLLADGEHTLVSDITSYNGVSSSNRIIFGSESGNATNAIVVSSNTKTMTLNEAQHIVLQYITINGETNDVALSLVGNCTDIEINGCTILGNPSGTNTAIRAIEYDNESSRNSGKKLDNIRILNNTISGGSYNMYINYPGIGSGAAMSGEIIIKNNTFTNGFAGAMYLMNYGYYPSISNNVIRTRDALVPFQQYGMNFSDNSTVDTVSGNKINMRGKGSVVGLRFANFVNTNARYKAHGGVFVVNNEIIAVNNNTRTTIGIQFGSSNVDLYHNSIYIAGSVKANAVEMSNDTTGYFSRVKNNLLVVATDTVAYPLYADHTYWASPKAADIDYNNYYNFRAGGPIAYAGDDRTTLGDLQAAIGQDYNSTNIEPEFMNINLGLEMETTSIFLCPVNSLVPYDIENMPRIKYTNIGAYGLPTWDLDAALTEISFNPLNLINQPSTPILTLRNTGLENIDSVLIHYSYNGATETSLLWDASSVSSLAEVDINLNAFTPNLGMNTIKAWLSKINEVALDSFQWNDTISIDFYGCDEILSGPYTVGTGGDFETVEEFLAKVAGCGVNDNITLAFKDGNHTGHLDLASIASQLGTYSLTITSENSDTALVRLVAASGAVITLGGNQNVTIKDITIDATQARYGVQFVDACENIIIDGCAVLANPTTTSSNSIAIYKADETGVLGNIQIINNRIDGGYSGLYLYGGIGQNSYAQNVILDSNTFSNQSHYGIYSYYTDFSSISHNTVLSRTSNLNSGWNAMRLHYSNGNITANRIKQQTNTITSPWGIHLSHYNYYNGNPNALIANNEIMLNNTTDSRAGIHVESSDVTIIHNSIYISGTTASRGIEIEGNDVEMTIRNNNLVTMSSTSYPFFIAQTSILDRADINYNNYYAPQYIGYVGENVTSMSAWKQIIGADTSVRVDPDFVAVSTNLELNEASDLLSPLYPGVDKDINGVSRNPFTPMGAYHSELSPVDIRLISIANLKQEVVNNESVSIEVEVRNVGNTSVTEVTFGWSVNGGTTQTAQWSASTMQTFDIVTIPIGDFKATGATTFDVKVWVETVNTAPSAITFNDTVSASVSTVDLIGFVDPLVASTINTLSFDVYAKIHEGTGATINTPKMEVKTIIQGVVFTNTIDMIPTQNSIWVANIPQQYYGSKVIYSLTVSDTVGNNNVTIMDSTLIQYQSGGELYLGSNLSLQSIKQLVADGECIPDYAPVIVSVANTGEFDYDFSVNPITLGVRVTNPIPFFKDTLLTSGTLLKGGIMTITLTNVLPIIQAGTYDITTYVNSPLDDVIYDDTLVTLYVSGKFKLPFDEDFSSGWPVVFRTEVEYGSNDWVILSQGAGADTAVRPQFGTGMITFSGSKGDMSTLLTQQLDLSQTIQPALSFWYFHDTVPCDDYTEVRISIDGGKTYSKLHLLTKYDAQYGWKQYSADLPDYAVNQCVILAFEAMEKSDSNVTQYIDRVRIDAKEDIAITEVIVSEFSVCDLEDKELKVVISNMADPVWIFDDAPTDLVLEIVGTSHRFTHQLKTGSLASFASDTIPMTTDFDFSLGTHNIRVYFTSIIDDDPVNNVYDTSIVISPKFTIEIQKLSEGGKASVGFEHKQVVILENEGNMDLSEIELILSVNLPEAAPHFIITKITDRNLSPGDTMHVTFDSAYSVPNSSTYEVTVNGSLVCAPALVYALDSKLEEVDTEDLAIIEIVKPEDDETEDVVGSEMEVSIRIENKSLAHAYGPGDVKVGYMLIGSDGNPIGVSVEEEVDASIGSGDTISFTFETEYRVPAMKEYTLVVYIKEIDKYNQNDTMTMDRITDYVVNISDIDKVSFTMEQNFPNPAKDKTVINYNIPQDGEITFAIYGVNGQLLYNKKETAFSGDNQVELNISDYASGIYLYTMEYKGQRIVKKMSVRR